MVPAVHIHGSHVWKPREDEKMVSHFQKVSANPITNGTTGSKSGWLKRLNARKRDCHPQSNIATKHT